MLDRQINYSEKISLYTITIKLTKCNELTKKIPARSIILIFGIMTIVIIIIINTIHNQNGPAMTVK